MQHNLHKAFEHLSLETPYASVQSTQALTLIRKLSFYNFSVPVHKRLFTHATLPYKIIYLFMTRKASLMTEQSSKYLRRNF